MRQTAWGLNKKKKLESGNFSKRSILNFQHINSVWAKKFFKSLEMEWSFSNQATLSAPLFYCFRLLSIFIKYGSHPYCEAIVARLQLRNAGSHILCSILSVTQCSVWAFVGPCSFFCWKASLCCVEGPSAHMIEPNGATWYTPTLFRTLTKHKDVITHKLSPIIVSHNYCSHPPALHMPAL